LQDAHQVFDILKVEAGRGFVKEVEEFLFLGLIQGVGDF
jgi:hypothetical protein